VRDGEVDDGRPDAGEQQPRAEPHAIGHRTQIRATVMIAKVAWNATKSRAGMVPDSG
jgi:hypothetical protein